MFTGLIEWQAKVIRNEHVGESNRLVIQAPDAVTFDEGESLAVNGVCLTLLADKSQGLAFDVSPETQRLTTLGRLLAGDKVNLERAMLATSRFGGHYVSGHVDTTARIMAINKVDEFIEMLVGDFGMPAEAYLLPKGSICLDGVSLTINGVKEGVIQLMLVPHTLAVTTLGQARVGQRLNVEFDYFTRIVAHQLMLVGQLKSEV